MRPQVVTDRLPGSFAGTSLRGEWGEVTEDMRRSVDLSHFFQTGRRLHQCAIQECGFPLVLWRREARTSQLDLLRRLEASALPPRLAVVADSGEAFRGHFERHWEAAPGNLHVALFLREPIPITKAGMGFAILPSLALADAAAEILGRAATVRIKWMNDILADGRKIGGSLAVTTAKGATVESAILGMGLNLARTPRVPPDPFVPRVGSIGEHTDPPPPEDALVTLLRHADRWLEVLRREGAAPLAAHHRALSAVLSERVVLFDDGPHLDAQPLGQRPVLARGVVEEIGDHLELCIGGHWFTRGRLAFEADLAPWGVPGH